MGACGAKKNLAVSRSLAHISTHYAKQLLASLVGASQNVRTPFIICPGRRLKTTRPWARCRRSQRAWCAKKPRFTLHVVTDEEGRPEGMRMSQGQGCVHTGLAHWRQERATVGDHSCETILGMYKRLQTIYFAHSATKNSTRCLPTQKDSAPDPDGLPYSVCRCSGWHWCPHSSLMLTDSSLLVAASRSSSLLPAEVFIPKSAAVDDQGSQTR